MVEDTWNGCTPDGQPPVIGQEYTVNHSRKGKFSGVVKSADETWATLEITGGVANAIMDYNIKLEGETVSCRNSLCRMTPISAAVSPQTK